MPTLADQLRRPQYGRKPANPDQPAEPDVGSMNLPRRRANSLPLVQAATQQSPSMLPPVAGTAYGNAMPQYGIPAMDPKAVQHVQGAGKYATRLADALQDPNAKSPLMTNAQAAGFQQETGYQPNKTVGGNFGQRAATPDALIAQGKRNSSPDYMRDPMGFERMARMGGQTLDAAVNDPNFNADGRLFQGARLGKDANGRATFTSAPKAPQYAGGSKEAADEMRAKALENLRQRTGGAVESDGTFFGPTKTPGQTGGSPLSQALPQARTEAQSAFLAARAAKDVRTQGAVEANAQARMANRQKRLAGPTIEERLAANNPQFAAQLARINADKQIAQGGFANNLAVGNLDPGGLRAAQAEQARGAGGLAERLQAGQVAAQDKRDALQFAGLGEQRAAQAEQARGAGGLAERLQKGELDARNALGTAEIDGRTKVAEVTAAANAARDKTELQRALTEMGIPQHKWPASARDGVSPQLGGVAGGAGPQNLQEALPQPGAPVASDKPVFLGGRVSEEQMAQLEANSDDPSRVAELLAAGGLTGSGLNTALNAFYSKDDWQPRRTAENPEGGLLARVLGPDGKPRPLPHERALDAHKSIGKSIGKKVLDVMPRAWSEAFKRRF